MRSVSLKPVTEARLLPDALPPLELVNAVGQAALDAATGLRLVHICHHLAAPRNRRRL